MRLEIDKDAVLSMGNEELFLFVLKPVAAEMHSKNGSGRRYDIYQELSGGQKAAFMYWVLHSHTVDVLQFYTWIPYMRQPQPNYWEQLIKGMKLIDCTEAIHFLSKCDIVFSALEQGKDGWETFAPADLENEQLKQQIQELYREFKELDPRILDFIGQYIRNNWKDLLSQML